MFKSYLKFSMAIASLLVLNSASSAQAHGVDDHDFEVESIMRAREDQMEFFQKLQEDIRNGVPVDISSGSCKYISSIMLPPPPKVVALTFDDGPASDLTPEVMGILKKHGIKATFFLKGNQAKRNPRVVRRLSAEGHIVASHSWSHPNFHQLSSEDQVGEVTMTDDLLKGMMKPLKLFRYPYGNSTCLANNLLTKRMGYSGIVGWHVDSCDWAFARTGSVAERQAAICGVRRENTANFAGHVVSTVERRGGGIVLFHDVHVRTVATLEAIIVRLKARGYTFTNLDDPRMAKYFVK